MPDLSDLATAFAAVLDALPQPILLVDADATVRHANRAAAELLRTGDGLASSDDRLSAGDPAETARLRRTIATTAKSHAHQLHGTLLSVRRPSPQPPLSLLIWRLDHSPRLAVVFVGDPSHRAALNEHTLRELYGLTRAEARIASFLADGHDITEAAAQLHIGRSTARTHLARVLAKTGTKRQAALVRLLLASPANVRAVDDCFLPSGQRPERS